MEGGLGTEKGWGSCGGVYESCEVIGVCEVLGDVWLKKKRIDLKGEMTQFSEENNISKV